MSRFLRFTVAIALSVCAAAAVALPPHTTSDDAVAACTTCWT